MKNTLIIILFLVIGLLVGSKVNADWERLVTLEETSSSTFGTVHIVFDKVEKVNCYVFEGYSGKSGISCLPAKK